MKTLLSLTFIIFTSLGIAQDIYNSSTGQLTIPSIIVGGTTYKNVVVSVSGVVSVGGTGVTYNNSSIYAILVTLSNNPNQFNSTLQGQSFSGSGTIQNFNNNTVSPSTNYLVNLGVSGYGIRCYTYDAGSISVLNQKNILGKTVNFQGQLSNASSANGTVLAIDPCAITGVN
jgi:hypothetical protein